MKFIKNTEKEIDENTLNKLSEHFNLDRKIIEILINRGYDTPDKIENFFHADIKNLHNPYLLNNMKEGVDRIVKAIDNNERVVIFGDYDVDGISAISILYTFLKDKIQNLFTYMPNRFEDGYGLSEANLTYIKNTYNPSLIITVDCGISCYNEIEFVKGLGVEVIVTDHHDIPKIIPNCLVINPKIENQKYPFNALCGAGVALKIVQALCEIYKESLDRFLPLAAIATVADIVALTDENRIIVKEGLKRFNFLPLGVKLLLKNTSSSVSASSTDIAFRIAPKINSAGRINDANIALKLFISQDLKVINESLNQIEYYNDKRREICDKIYVESKELLEKLNLKDKKILVLYGENWDNGVLGIVSARLCEEFNKPVILLCKLKGELKGSGRSFGNIDLYKALESCAEYLLKFGGHPKAGGLSLKPENLKTFTYNINKYICENYTDADFECVKTYDADIDIKDINVKFIEDLKLFEPFGFENSNPVFKLDFSACKVNKMKNHSNHLMLELENKLSLVAFNNEVNYFNFLYFNKKSVLIELEINEFRGKKSAKGLVKSSKFNNVSNNILPLINANYLRQLEFEYPNKSFSRVKFFNSNKQLSSLLDKTRVLIITYNLSNLKGLNIENFNFCAFNINHNSKENTICFGLNSTEKLKNFNKIIFLEKPISDFYENLPLDISVYVPEKPTFDIKSNLKVNREDFLNIYYIMQKSKIIETESVYDYYLKVVLQNKKYSYAMFYSALIVFKQLKLVTLTEENGKVKIVVNKIKTELENSEIYKKLRG